MIAILAKDGLPDHALARRMLAAAPHRGDCVTLRVAGRCVLGVANHADSTHASISSDGPVVAALAGRVDNAAQLYEELVAAGTPPASPAGADVVVALFRSLGPDAPRRLRGCFAAIVTDGNTLSCFRDHIGFKPLFYRDDPRAFTAASEARQVVVGAGLSEEPDWDVLMQILFGRMPADTPAALKGVARLAQGTTLTLNGHGRVALRRYWHPVDLLETARLSPGELEERFAHLMEQAAARMLTGRDVILLSGGVDSPAVASFAAPEHQRRYGSPLGALSAVFPDLPNVDERPYIELVSGQLGIDLHTHRPAARALDDVEHWARVCGGPVPIVSIPELAENHTLARRLGYDTILTGDFAEFVVGNPWHLIPHLLTHGRWGALGRLLSTEWRHGAAPWFLAQHVLTTLVPGRLANGYLHWRRRDAPERIPDWLDARRVLEQPFRGDLLPAPWQRWRRLQLAGTEGSTISMEADEICATLAGVTVRRPFADIDLWEFFLSLPAQQKCPRLRFKTLLRRLLRGRVPDAILHRPRKTVFDDHVMAQVDYGTLERLLVAPRQQMPGVDYKRLAQRIEQRDFTRFDWYWAKDLTHIHAFLSTL